MTKPELRNSSGYPVSPVDEIMRRGDGPSREDYAERMGFRPSPVNSLANRIASACVVGLLVILMVSLAACGGTADLDIDPTEDPPVEFRWTKEFCEVPAGERYARLLEFNQRHEGELAVAVACPQADGVNMSFQEGTYLGFPALRLYMDTYFFLGEDEGNV